MAYRRPSVVFAFQALLIGALLVGADAGRSQTGIGAVQGSPGTISCTSARPSWLEARDHAVAANRSKSMFLANMSHELRTPLNAILGFSGMCAGMPRSRNTIAMTWPVVGSSGEHLLGLIDDVLDMAKIESGDPSSWNVVALDVLRLVRETMDMLQEPARAKNLQLLFEASLETPRFIRSDPGKLRAGAD